MVFYYDCELLTGSSFVAPQSFFYIPIEPISRIRGLLLSFVHVTSQIYIEDLLIIIRLIKTMEHTPRNSDLIFVKREVEMVYGICMDTCLNSIESPRESINVISGPWLSYVTEPREIAGGKWGSLWMQSPILLLVTI